MDLSQANSLGLNEYSIAKMLQILAKSLQGTPPEVLLHYALACSSDSACEWRIPVTLLHSPPRRDEWQGGLRKGYLVTQTTDLRMKSLKEFELVLALDSLYPNQHSDLNYTYPTHRLVLKHHTKSLLFVCSMCCLQTPLVIFYLCCWPWFWNNSCCLSVYLDLTFWNLPCFGSPSTGL